MKKRGGFTLQGPAAGSYLEAQEGVLPKTDAERALRIATIVYVNMQTHPEAACALIRLVAREGLEAAAKICTARSGAQPKGAST